MINADNCCRFKFTGTSFFMTGGESESGEHEQNK